MDLRVTRFITASFAHTHPPLHPITDSTADNMGTSKVMLAIKFMTILMFEAVPVTATGDATTSTSNSKFPSPDCSLQQLDARVRAQIERIPAPANCDGPVYARVSPDTVNTPAFHVLLVPLNGRWCLLCGRVASARRFGCDACLACR
jgi:hypothetical protein